MFTGPTVVEIPVHIDWDRIQSRSVIATETNQYGVEVVEQPVETLGNSGTRGLSDSSRAARDFVRSQSYPLSLESCATR